MKKQEQGKGAKSVLRHRPRRSGADPPWAQSPGRRAEEAGAVVRAAGRVTWAPPSAPAAAAPRRARSREGRAGAGHPGARPPGATAPPRGRGGDRGGGSGRGPAPGPSINAPGRPVPRVPSAGSRGRRQVGAARGRFAATPGARRARSRSHAVLAHAARALQPAQLRQLPAVRAAAPPRDGRDPRGAAGVGGPGAVGRPGAGREPQGPGSPSALAAPRPPLCLPFWGWERRR